MAEELPDGTRQGYFASCPKCRKTIETNIQGNILSDHNCYKNVKLESGGGIVGIVDYENKDISFSNYNIKTQISELSFNDIKNIYESIFGI
jgi:hypothetical protein